MKNVILIKGPTASGKTILAEVLSKHLELDLISVDSAQIYRDMNIGTAKPDKRELTKYPHALIDIKNPDETYSASEFVDDVSDLIKKSHKNNKLPCLVGGTMMYFNALQKGLSDLPKANELIRQKIMMMANKKGWLYCYKELKKVDPVSANRINPNDTQRIQRALEVYKITGQPMTDLIGRKKNSNQYQYKEFAYFPKNREALHNIIEKRFKRMVKQGLVEELENLLTKYKLHKDMPSLRCVGYRQVYDYLKGNLSKEEMLEKGIVATRQLAKRQMTWLRRESESIIIEPYKNINKQVLQVLKNL